MKLLLASVAAKSESLTELSNFVGKPLSELSVAYIPTAANWRGRGSWKGSSSLEKVSSMAKEIRLVELEDYYKEDIRTVLEPVDVLWIGGGLAGYLMYWIRMVHLDKYLPDILEEKIYVGSSVGSMICSNTLYAAEWFIGEEEPGASVIPGLGYIDFEIYPHYQDALRNQIEEKWKKGKLALLKDGETILYDNGNLTFTDEKRVLKK